MRGQEPLLIIFKLILCTIQFVLQTGSKHLFIHLGQSTFSHPLSGHLISHTGGSH